MSSKRKAKGQKVGVPSAVWDNGSSEDRRMLRRGLVAKESDELRAQKISKIKQQIEEGTYHVDAAEVAKAIVRHETARLLGHKR